jgi:phosphoribosylformylglycinamidine synthase II
VGGEAAFEACYNGNPLVNAMTVGIVRPRPHGQRHRRGAGQSGLPDGSQHGPDGIHGATFASVELTSESEEKRSNVQVGDPFMEKLLLEATLELIASGAVVGIQDMGAAGITCSCSEMSAKGGCGIRIEIDKVPQREPGMTAYEVLLSESQERMLVVMKKGQEAVIRRICERWDIHCAEIGVVTDTGLFEVFHQGEQKASVPSHSLVLGGGAPVYIREWAEPASFQRDRQARLEDYPEPADLAQPLRHLLAHPTIASKRWIYRQYDHMVGAATTVRPGGDAAVVRVKGSGLSLAVSTDCNSRLVKLDPRAGTRAAVAEAARNIACTGAMPLAVTNCLNFGNPLDPEIYWQFREAIAGMGEACRALETPVTGGNVSFYNESPQAAVYPTPVIGMVGLLDHDRPTPSAFQAAGHEVLLLGVPRPEPGGSLYFEWLGAGLAGRVADPDLAHERRLHTLLAEASRAGLLASAHDVSEGGLAVCLAEACLLEEGRLLGARLSLPFEGRRDALLFCESPGLVVVSCAPADRPALVALAARHGAPLAQLGHTGGERLVIDGAFDLPLEELAGLWWHSLEALMEPRPAHA